MPPPDTFNAPAPETTLVTVSMPELTSIMAAEVPREIFWLNAKLIVASRMPTLIVNGPLPRLPALLTASTPALMVVPLE